jgi:hypothetical protein
MPKVQKFINAFGYNDYKTKLFTFTNNSKGQFTIIPLNLCLVTNNLGNHLQQISCDSHCI